MFSSNRGKNSLITIAKSFSIPYDQLPSAKIHQAQYSVIQDMAAQGDRVIVGRCSDYILRELHPINIFIYADIKTKIARCRSRTGSNEDLSENELKKRIRNIDKSRSK
ncbi:AAA family ATPase [Alkalibaculum sporogenes]|uniref:cytidylate kinase-like family protein n=1 Tax=Alkalibaculum sporogenes TaxID=2655001 RepID=UPI00187B9DE9|nr:cytidylate kinase family protein [Alkalibaculum sporogenes]